MIFVRASLVIFSFLLMVIYVHSAPKRNATASTIGTQTRSHPFVGFYVFPHGGVTLNPKTHDFSEEGGAREGSREESIRLHEAMQSAAKSLMESRPDIVILSTPHGYYLEERYLFVGNPSMSGNAGWEWSNMSATFNIAKEDTVNLFLELVKEKNPVDLLAFGIGQTQMSLQWAEVIPWYFVQEAAKQLRIPLPWVIYIGQPPTKKMAELDKLGKDIASFVKKSYTTGKRIALLVSGDLSHYHANDTKAPYPFNPNSVVFDALIKEWGMIDRSPATEGQANEVLLRKAEAVSDSAGSCGYPGLVMMHSVIGSLVTKGRTGVSFKAKFYDYAAPTYFGMMVTSWIP